MRAGMNTLAAAVCAEPGDDPRDGTLWVFLSRDLRRCKMLRCDAGCWCMWTLLPSEGAFRWAHSRAGGVPIVLSRARGNKTPGPLHMRRGASRACGGGPPRGPGASRPLWSPGYAGTYGLTSRMTA